MTTLRVTVDAEDADVATEVKEKFFKDLYEHAGTKVVFEVPADAQDKVDAITAFAKDKGCEVSSEVPDDDLDDAEPVSFW